MILPVVASLLFAHAPADGVNLARKFTKGEVLTYDVKSTLQIQTKPMGLDTYMPEDLELSYRFTTQVVDTKADGIVVMKYLRPTMTQVAGETWNSPPKTTVEKVNYNLLLTVSPINEILEMKDQSKKAGWMTPGGGVAFQNPMGQFVSEVYRLALNVGGFDTSLDFAPKLPFNAVKVGDTWQRTASYQPQKLKGDNKSAVQRLDYTYTYKGPVDVNGKKFERVNATLNLNTDLADFLNQVLGTKPEESGLKSMPLQLQANIDFNLDPATHKTMSAIAESTGGFKVFIAERPNTPVQDQKIKGRTIMKLVPTPTKGK